MAMRESRLYVGEALESGAHLTLGADAANYLGRVLRVRAGTPIVLFNGSGGEFEATVTRLEKRSVVVEVGRYRNGTSESPCNITLLQALVRGERMDFAVQKATELGVTTIVPVTTEFTQVTLDAARRASRREHWHGVAIAAAQQCGRTALPVIAPVASLADALAELPAGNTRLVAATIAAAAWPPGPATNVALAIGPEGGFSAADERLFVDQGFQPVSLGPRVLRTETATVAGIAMLQARYGDLG